MVARLPLVLGGSGLPQQLQPGDTLSCAPLTNDVTVTFAAPAIAQEFAIADANATAVGMHVYATAHGSPPAGAPGATQDELEMDPILVVGRVATIGTVLLKVISQGRSPLLGARRLQYFLTF